MSTAAVSLCVARLTSEEGFRQYPYDDATGERVHAPVGNLTWLYGLNLDAIGNPALGHAIIALIVDDRDFSLSVYSWYLNASTLRQSVLLDMAFNLGVAGLVHGYPKMIAAMTAGDWTTAAAECKVADVRLDASRYAPLRQLLTQGNAP